MLNFIPADPGGGLRGEAAGSSLPDAAKISMNLDGAFGIGVLDHAGACSGSHDQAGLLQDFADHTIGRIFPGVALTAGEFPEACKRTFTLALRNQEFTLLLDDGYGNTMVGNFSHAVGATRLGGPPGAPETLTLVDASLDRLQGLLGHDIT